MSVTDEIKARIDIVDFIARHVPLQRSGRTYKACCPFHQERTPSFIVFPETGTWRCFGACGTGGDVFSFLMAKENLDFREALGVLAAEAGIDLEDRPEDGERREKARLYEVNGVASQFYRNILHRHPMAQKGRQYLQKRGIDTAVAESFQLGFAPDAWDGLRDHLLEQGYDLELQHRAGLLKHNEEHNSYYDAFRNRLMIPISDRQGRIIGFGGRVLDDSVPKYLNTSETPLFHKSATVYGLDRAHRAIRDADAVVIVEGYMDVIAAHQHGFTNVVACLGTALTEEQLQQLQRFTDTYILALDADSAGQQATIRGLNQARQALKRTRKPVLTPSGRVRMEARLGANLRIAALPEGQDPDDIVRRDPEGWRSLIEGAQPLVDFYISVVAANLDLESAQGKGEAVAELSPLIAELADEIERQHYIQQLSRLIQIDEQTIERRVEAAARAMARPPGRQRSRPRFARPGDRGGQGRDGDEAPEQASLRIPPRRSAGPENKGQPGAPGGEALEKDDGNLADSGPRLEKYLLANLLEDPNLLVWLSEVTAALEIAPLGAADLQRIEYRELFHSLKRFITSDEDWDLESFQESLNPELVGRLADLLQHAAQLPDREPAELQEAIVKVLIRMRRERLREDLSAMQFLLRDAQQNGDWEAILGYSASINANRRDRHHLDRVLVRLNRAPYGASPGDDGVRIA